MLRSKSSLKGEEDGNNPMDTMTISVFKICSDPSIGTGLFLPLSSGSPSFIFIHLTAVNWLFSPINSTGFFKNRNSIPSSSASFISMSAAGICSLSLRYAITTCFAFKRNAVRAESIATFPPPHTITVLPVKSGLSP